jgi:hypothetical protein
MLAVQAITQQAESARIALIIGTLAVLAYGRHLLFMVIRVLIIMLVIATLVGAVVIADLIHA